MVGIIVSIGWYNLRSSKFGINVISDEGLVLHGFKGPASLEHYHMGLGVFIISLFFFTKSVGFMEGLGLSLIAVETIQDNPFGIGKDHFLTSTVMGAALFLLLILLYLK